MNAGIRAASAADLNLAVEEVFSRLSQFASDGASVLLFLPTAVARAVVFEREFPGSHRSIFNQTESLFYQRE